MSISNIWELVDTKEDGYRSYGIFLSLEDAKKELFSYREDEQITDTDDDVEILTIFERKIGKGDGSFGKEVFAISRNFEYCTEKDQYVWMCEIKETLYE
jgi:hypothetical protein